MFTTLCFILVSLPPSRQIRFDIIILQIIADRSRAAASLLWFPAWIGGPAFIWGHSCIRGFTAPAVRVPYRCWTDAGRRKQYVPVALVKNDRLASVQPQQPYMLLDRAARYQETTESGIIKTVHILHPVTTQYIFITSCVHGRPPQYAPAPVTLTFDLLILKVVSKSRVTGWVTVPNLVALGKTVRACML